MDDTCTNAGTNPLADPARAGRVYAADERPYRARFRVCDAWTERGLRCDARTITRADILANDPAGNTVYPRYCARAEGAYLWDVDGRRYVDFLLGYGPVVLGHADERVTAAVVRELQQGHSIAPLWSPRQIELCELLTSVIPGAELAYTLKTGSDATSAAVRLARIFTGREKVVRWGYNGWHDWAVASPAGVPESIRNRTAVLKELSAPALAELLERDTTPVACVLVMPFEYDVIQPDTLHKMAAISRNHGALFILDEMRSGFRMALGGAQEYFDLKADLSTFSKAMANGFPISAVVGRRDVMNCLGKTRISSTFYASPVEMVAAITTISILRDTDALTHVWTVGALLQSGLHALVDELDVPAEVVGYPPSPFLRWNKGFEHLQWQFYVEATRGGVLLHPNHQWFVSAAHSKEDIAFSLDVCRRAFRIVMG